MKPDDGMNMKTIRRENFIILCPTAIMLLVALMGSPSFGAVKYNLPEPEGWHIVSYEERRFETPKADLGYMLQQKISSGLEKADVILMAGAGPGRFYVPDGNISEDDRPIGFGATYETTRIKGFRSVMEDYPYIGISLSVQLPGTQTLIIESDNMSKEEIKGLAEIYVDKIINETPLK